MSAESVTPLYNFLVDWFSKGKASKRESDRRLSAVLFTHRQADPDALCSAAGLSLLIERMLPEQIEIKIIVPQGASTLGRNVCNRFGLQFEEVISEDDTKEADLLVALDVGEPELLQPFLGLFVASQGTKILVD